jgi:hypothetical protein
VRRWVGGGEEAGNPFEQRDHLVSSCRRTNNSPFRFRLPAIYQYVALFWDLFSLQARRREKAKGL